MMNGSDGEAAERFVRVVGKRRQRPPGTPPSAEARAAFAECAQYRTRAPKGVFIYASHEEANADRDRWTVEAVVSRARNA